MLRSRIEAIRKIADSHLSRNRRDCQSNRPEQANAESTEESLAPGDVQHTAQQALALVLQTGAIIRAAEERGQAIADKGQELAVRAVSELQLADERIKSLEQRLAQAEARAKQAEEWLQRVCGAVETNLSDYTSEISLTLSRRAA